MKDIDTKPLFLLTGFASEYSLKPLAMRLQQVGEEVIEVDFSRSGVPEIGHREIVLITSQHPARTSWIFKQAFGDVPLRSRYLSPMECMRHFNVRCSVFVPHDLEQPIITDEICYLQLFDFYCSPYEFMPGISLVCEPLHTGWVKHLGFEKTEFEHCSLARKNGVFFVNQLVELIRRGGATYLIKAFAIMIESQIPFKLPCWPGAAELEEALIKAGALVIPCETVSTQVIAESAQVFSNAPGSILAEAAYIGVSAHVIPPGSRILPTGQARKRESKLFDFSLLMKAINNHLQKGAAK